MAKKRATVIQMTPKIDWVEKAERLVDMLFARDREIQARKEKLLNRALDLIEKDAQQAHDQLAELLRGSIAEFSKIAEKVVDLKKLEAMAPEMKEAVKGRAAGARSV